jgi:hypothetical protein
MHSARRAAYDTEIALAKERISEGDPDAGVVHLERAHVIGQAFVGPHARSHWLMLKVDLWRRRPAAAFGQALRIILGVLGSAVGIVPVGNTGGSNVSMFKRMPIAPELQRIIDGSAPPDPPA